MLLQPAMRTGEPPARPLEGAAAEARCGCGHPPAGWARSGIGLVGVRDVAKRVRRRATAAEARAGHLACALGGVQTPVPRSLFFRLESCTVDSARGSRRRWRGHCTRRRDDGRQNPRAAVHADFCAARLAELGGAQETSTANGGNVARRACPLGGLRGQPPRNGGYAMHGTPQGHRISRIRVGRRTLPRGAAQDVRRSPSEIRGNAARGDPRCHCAQ
mmetsp:Transcript_35427/g.97803  ORF Transcript_35427/g.97803 Transcript_35427/m.97803 type:complete len:217 (+) Transcript_35427:1855-2505(+)